MTVRDPLTLRSSAQRPSIDGIVGLLRALYTYDAANDILTLGSANLTVRRASAAPTLALETYSATITDRSIISLRKSASATLGTLAETAASERLGLIEAQAVNTALAFTTAASIAFLQKGAAGAAQVGGEIRFSTATASAATAVRLTITSQGNLSVGSSTGDSTNGVHNIVLDNTSTVVGAATANRVSLAAFDVAAGDTALYVQPETASLHRFGKQAYHKQGVTTGAVAVLSLEQLDIDQAMLDLVCTIGTGNGIEAVGTKTLTTTHFAKVTIPGGLTVYFPMGTIA